ncbi:FAD-dependent monooxygenase [Paraburkholderia dipogonis]|uniref:FAD-dependent monooxygenase n=1 Tax=Paraburkholderia dipogonis TaxID=1211383 RepID=UPI0035EBED0A
MAIVGAGPVGCTVANLLGVYGIEAMLIDRSEDILPYPRAVGMDDEALRVFQIAGVAEALLDDVIQNVFAADVYREGRIVRRHPSRDA